MEADAVADGDEQQRPMRSSARDGRIVAVCQGEEDVGDVFKGREGGGEGKRVGRLGEHEGHAGPEEDDFGCGGVREVFALEVSCRQGGSAGRVHIYQNAVRALFGHTLPRMI